MLLVLFSVTAFGVVAVPAALSYANAAATYASEVAHVPEVARTRVVAEPAAAKAKPQRPAVTEVRLADAGNAGPALLAARSTGRFGLLGVTWQNAGSGAVSAQVRMRTNHRWTAWQALAADADHAPDQAEGIGRGGTEPLWVGAADGVQAKVTSLDGKPVKDVRVALIDSPTQPQDAVAALDNTALHNTALDNTALDNAAPVEAPQASTMAAAAARPAPYARPPIVTRAGWGADESLRRYNAGCAVPSYGSTIRGVFVHHTAGSNSYTSSQSASIIRGIYAYHVQSRGWCDIGYNFLVDRYGRIFEGRYGGITLPVVGAHTANHNGNTFGVSLMGTFTSATPTAVMMESAAKVIAWKLDGNYRNPNSTMVLTGGTYRTVSGHRDATATDCPGATVYSRLPALRSRVWTLMGGSATSDIYAYAVSLGGFAKIGEPYYLEHPVAGGGLGTWFGVRDIYWSSSTGARSVFGAIRVLHRQLGNADGVLGVPSAEQALGRLSGSWLQEFRRSGARRVVYWSSATGAHEVYDQILTKYAAMGAETSALGLPATGPRATSVPYSRYAVFQRGRMYYSPATGTHPIIGAINARYVRSDAYPRLGFPTGDQYATSTGLAQRFQHGRIELNSRTGVATVIIT